MPCRNGSAVPQAKICQFRFVGPYCIVAASRLVDGARRRVKQNENNLWRKIKNPTGEGCL